MFVELQDLYSCMWQPLELHLDTLITACTPHLCALLLVQITCEEILEEVGYQVEPHQLVSCAGSVISSAGITGSSQTMFFAQVSLTAAPYHTIR